MSKDKADIYKPPYDDPEFIAEVIKQENKSDEELEVYLEIIHERQKRYKPEYDLAVLRFKGVNFRDYGLLYKNFLIGEACGFVGAKDVCDKCEGYIAEEYKREIRKEAEEYYDRNIRNELHEKHLIVNANDAKPEHDINPSIANNRECIIDGVFDFARLTSEFAKEKLTISLEIISDCREFDDAETDVMNVRYNDGDVVLSSHLRLSLYKKYVNAKERQALVELAYWNTTCEGSEKAKQLLSACSNLDGGITSRLNRMFKQIFRGKLNKQNSVVNKMKGQLTVNIILSNPEKFHLSK